jgi:hypothetical protein
VRTMPSSFTRSHVHLKPIHSFPRSHASTMVGTVLLAARFYPKGYLKAPPPVRQWGVGALPGIGTSARPTRGRERYGTARPMARTPSGSQPRRVAALRGQAGCRDRTPPAAVSLPVPYTMQQRTALRFHRTPRHVGQRGLGETASCEGQHYVYICVCGGGEGGARGGRPPRLAAPHFSASPNFKKATVIWRVFRPRINAPASPYRACYPHVNPVSVIPLPHIPHSYAYNPATKKPSGSSCSAAISAVLCAARVRASGRAAASTTVSSL